MRLISNLGKGLAVLLLLAATTANEANASILTPVSASGTGSFSNSPNLIVDGVVPEEFTFWQANSNVWWHGNGPVFTIDLGGQFVIQDLVVLVDNNDIYNISYSADNVAYNPLLSVQPGYGEVYAGLDNMSTIAGDSQYISAIDFSPVQGRFLQIVAAGGDDYYAIGEIQIHGETANHSNPEPASIILLGIGTISIGARAICRRNRKS